MIRPRDTPAGLPGADRLPGDTERGRDLRLGQARALACLTGPAGREVRAGAGDEGKIGGAHGSSVGAGKRVGAREARHAQAARRVASAIEFQFASISSVNEYSRNLPVSAEPGPVLPMPHPPRRDASPYCVYLARFSGEAERTMRRCLDRIAATFAKLPEDEPVPARYGEPFPWHQIRRQHAVLLKTRLSERWASPSHPNKHLSALRGVMEECWNLGLVSAEEYEKIRKIKNVKGSRVPAGRNIHQDEMATLLAHCLADETPAGVRDAAMVAVLYSTGIRREEAARAMIERFDPAERALRVVGKGNKERSVYLNPSAVPYLDRWLRVIGERRGPLFRPVDQWGNVPPRAMTPRAIGAIVARRHAAAKVAPLSTHDFRRTFIGDFIDSGGDLVQAQQLAGHASASTTSSYDRRPGRALRAAVDQMRLPEPARPGGVRS